MTLAPSPSAAAFDPAAYRADFPVLDRQAASGAPLAFLDNAASTQRPTQVIDAMSDCYRSYYANVHRGIHTLSEESTAAFEQARATVAEFLNTKQTREIIFTAGATASINTVARSWGDANVGAGDVILVTIAEHHANIVPWHQLAERTGCRVEFLPINDGFTIDDEVVAEALDRLRPKLFAFTAASNTLGTIFPVQRWTKLAHDHGATVLIDAAQAAPHQVVDVQQWDADFVVFSGHKVCGPTGIGVLYGKESLLEAMPPFLGGGGMIHDVTTSGFTCAGLPEKFEAGTPPIVEAIGLAAAVKYITAVGLDRIAAHEHALSEHAESRLREITGVQIVGPVAGAVPNQKNGIISIHLPGVHAHDVSQQLDSAGVAVRAGHHCTMPLHHFLKLSATARASFYLYNTIEEADRFVDAVIKVQSKFAPSGRKRRPRT
ncbi:MAG: SufS family cysteine desulfurase [Rubripirellula sp.]